jgi:hypothetical protein
MTVEGEFMVSAAYIYLMMFWVMRGQKVLAFVDPLEAKTSRRGWMN